MNIARVMALCSVAVFSAFPSRAETVRNGNEFALAYARADAFGKPALRKEAEGRLFTFRFLKVVRIETNAAPGGLPVLHTLEPSSGFTVVLHPQGRVSRQVVADVATNDHVVVNGRLAAIEPAANTFVIHPAVLRSKDRDAPKGEKELLYEIDPTAVR